MKRIALFALIALSTSSFAQEKPIQPEPQQPQIILQCGSLKGIGQLVVIDEEGEIHTMIVSCGTDV